jgi:outer membrane biosynthesis protein TonB
LPSIPAAAEGKGVPRLFFELYWGELRQHARSFGAIPAKKPVVGGLDDNAPMPLWGFDVQAGRMVLADKKGGGYRVFVPTGAAVERRGDDGNFYPLAPDGLEAIGQRKFIGLNNGQAVRFSGEGEISLVAYVQPPLPRPWSNPLKNLPLLALGLTALFFGLFAAFVSFAPSDEMPDFVNKNVPPVAVRLLAPEPKKKEEAQKKLEAIKKKEPEKKKVEVAKVEKPIAKPPPLATPPKIKALEKLSAAGPAMKDLLAAVDKLGNGPGKKDAKNNYKMADLIGKAPIANAGLGTFGIGGGGAGGMGTKGLEVLRGKGGGGIGALGAGNVGKGAVGGTVGRASVRSIGVQGTIDKEAVAKVINSHLSEVSACYERALLREPGLAGKIVLEWNISTSGGVTTAKTKSSTMKSSAVEACILTSLKTWKFPPAKGAGVVISYPFLFNSVGY